ncbi:MAG: DUF1127 domain-containing protein [Alphaproteobacteria bacterium]|nr:DUF1127 domain-containing protein [Alphaproteobacteria bacterium]MBV9554813.1 DUF1127 domain-containing protein [Alphaproteobacteria bacterium]
MFIVNLFAAAGQALSDWRHKQQAYAELMALDDRSLADIGIQRSEIPAIVEGADERSAPARDGEFVPGFATHKLAGGRQWFPWFPPL